MPFGPPLVETLVNETTNGVVPTVRVISTAGAPLVLTTPLVEVMVPLFSVASKPR